MANTPLDQRIITWIQNQFRFIVILCITSLVLGIGYLSWFKWSQYQETKIYSKLYVFKKSLTQSIMEANEQENFREKDENIYKILKKDFSQPVYSQKMNQISLAYEEKIKTFINKKITGLFVIDLADYYYKKGDVQKAQNLLSSFIVGKKPTGFIQLAYLQLISYYMNKTSCSKALPLLDKITEAKTAKPFHAEAWMQKGICYEEQKEWGKAEEMYKQSIKQASSPFYKKMAADYLRALQFNKKINLK